ncbi:MAG: carboxypeptidase-like regulatory domain-containing protein, partial [Bacteroidia bacterium]|nr:carboxypeptidase-like regulatory domain-containing protein [Bacteroidia bacterium]
MLIVSLAAALPSLSQEGRISGKILAFDNDRVSKSVEYATVFLKHTAYATTSDSIGQFSFQNLAPGTYTVEVSAVGFNKFEKPLTVVAGETLQLNLQLSIDKHILDEVVITGVTKATLIRENPVAIM